MKTNMEVDLSVGLRVYEYVNNGTKHYRMVHERNVFPFDNLYRFLVAAEFVYQIGENTRTDKNRSEENQDEHFRRIYAYQENLYYVMYDRRFDNNTKLNDTDIVVTLIKRNTRSPILINPTNNLGALLIINVRDDE